MRYFLLSFDRRNSLILGDIEEFDDPDAAIRARFSREADVRDSGIEVVVLGAANREALEKTHSRYFGGPDLRELSEVG